jgi:ABC-type nitrate/sulfonate/bicarbonate transport system permease component
LLTVRYRATNIAATIVLAVAVWEGIALLTRGIGFVSLADLVPAVVRIVTGSSFWSSVGFTIGLTVVGLLGGTLIAIVVGVPLGMSRLLDTSARGTVNFVRAIPTVILIPLLLASLGSRVSVVVILILLAVSLKMVVYVTRGMRDFSVSLSDQARLIGIRPMLGLLAIRLPAASAIVVSGIRQSVNRAYGAAILAGFLAGTPGLGRDINLANLRGDDVALLSYVVIAGIVSVLLYQAFVWAERRFVHWRVVA